MLSHYSDANNISGNNITNNEYTGIFLGDMSWRNNVSGNNIANNNYAGILLIYSMYNCISGNNITNNGNGIEFRVSPNNTIYHNNFIDNTQQVSIGGEIHTWDVGGEGNYWSDYKGVDYTGDGIGDTPYVIDKYNRDNHPFMRPWTPTWRPVPFWMRWWFWTIIAAGIAVVAIGAVYFLKKRKPPTPTAPTLPSEGTETSIK